MVSESIYYPEKITCVKDAIEAFDDLKTKLSRNKDDSFFDYLPGPDRSIFGLWFRGELDVSSYGLTPLTPSIFRENKKQKNYNETKIFDLLPSYHNNVREIPNSFDRLCMMEHYEIPSRLLDWTESILTALYFAVQEDEEEKGDAKLFALNALKLNDLSSLRNPPSNLHYSNSFGTLFRAKMVNTDTHEEWENACEDLLEKFYWSNSFINTKVIDYFNLTKEELSEEKGFENKLKVLSTPVAVMPNKITNRVINQNAMFTLHGGKIPKNNGDGHVHLPTPIGLKKLQEDFEKESFLKEYSIPKAKKEDIKLELMHLGIHQGSLFPELDKKKEFCLYL